MVKTYKVLSEGWLTDAHGTAKYRQVGDPVELTDDQAYWLKKARTVEPSGSDGSKVPAQVDQFPEPLPALPGRRK